MKKLLAAILTVALCSHGAGVNVTNLSPVSVPSNSLSVAAFATDGSPNVYRIPLSSLTSSSTGETNTWEANVQHFGAGSATNNSQPAIQAAAGYGIGLNGLIATSNKVLVFPGGTYYLKDTVNITNMVGGAIVGAGMQATRIVMLTNRPAFRFRGMTQSRIENMTIEAASSQLLVNAGYLVEIVGDTGTGIFGVQSCELRRVEFLGNDKAAGGLLLGWDGTSMTGNEMGSENLFSQCIWSGFTNVGVKINGYNALNNSFVLCTFQGGPHMTGLLNNGGSFHVFGGNGVRRNYPQDTYDISSINSSLAPSTITGFRSESLKWVNTGPGHVSIVGFQGAPSFEAWQAAHAYTNGQIVLPTWPNGLATNRVAWRCTTAGTSGGSEPSWPIVSGTVSSDGSASWESVDDVGLSLYDTEVSGGNFQLMRVQFSVRGQSVRNSTFSRADWKKDFNAGTASAIVENNWLNNPLATVGGTIQTPRHTLDTNVSLNVSAEVPGAGVLVSATTTAAAVGSYYGLQVYEDYSPAGDVSGNTAIGILASLAPSASKPATAVGVASAVNTTGTGTLPNAFGFRSSPATYGGAHTVSDFRHFGANDAYVADGAAITVQYGFYAAALSAGAANFAFYGAGNTVSSLGGGMVHRTNSVTAASIAEALSNGDFWTGTISNALQTAWKSNSVVSWKVLAP